MLTLTCCQAWVLPKTMSGLSGKFKTSSGTQDWVFGTVDMTSNLSLMTLPRHDDTMMTPAVVAMTAWMEDTSLRKTHKTKDR